MNLDTACRSANFKVIDHSDGWIDVECCGEQVTHESWAGGIFGPQRVWCENCGGEVRQRSNPDEYGVERTAGLGWP